MKYPRTYHFPFSPGATNDDRIANSMQALLGEEIIITEKLDGENTGMNNLGVYARSHATFTTSPWSKEVRMMHDLVNSFIDDDQMIFGENMEGIHSIEYSKLESYFYLFGSRRDTIWESWQEVEDLSFYIDAPTVPVLFKGMLESEAELQKVIEVIVAQPSILGNPVMEGCVVRVTRRFTDEEFSNVVMKWVRKDHVTTDEHWTRNWKKANLFHR